MDTAYLKLKIKRGATFRQEFQWLQSDGVTPIDITGYTFTCSIRSTVNASSILASLSVSIINAVQGKFAITGSAVVTGAIPSTAKIITDVDIYYYDLRCNTGATVEYPVEGDVEVVGAVTRG